ncbi:MAG TPA: F0F1 ATP synthase subunit A, partial [Pirellulaceae bacterium]|nr:F0F1 ATP synthase subunit A [Pirellulaceae bacterium]
DYQSKADFPDVWVKLDDQFQAWEFERHDGGLYHGLEKLATEAKVTAPDEHTLEHDWHHWQHESPANHGKPADVYLEEHADKLTADFNAWVYKKDNEGKSFDDFVATLNKHDAAFVWFAKIYRDPALKTQWTAIKAEAGGKKAIEAFKQETADKWQWNAEKLKYYNYNLSGKVLIPQPFGELRNMYQPETGFCISKFMIIELAVALIMLVAFSWVARRIGTAQPPKGRLWNLLETFLCFIRDQVAGTAIGGDHDHDDHGHEGHGHDDHGHGHGHKPAAHAHQAAKKAPISDKTLFAPVLWTIFFFVLGCNLFGILPWAGSPTASFNVTLALAGVTLLSVVVGGMRKFGFLGFFANQVPGMDLPFVLAIFLKPMIFAIEMVGLFIKHGVLAIRLLANMIAGHLVILGIMGLAFGLHAAVNFSAPDVPSWQWPLVATIAVVGSTLFNILELFVAFLQAYIFTFLSALFIGASVHKH